MLFLEYESFIHLNAMLTGERWVMERGETWLGE
jgi:hypothetical protein